MKALHLGRWIAVAAVVAATVLFYFSGWGRFAVAVACGDGILLDYQKHINPSWEDAFADVEIKVSNTGFSTIQLLGLSTPCPACINVVGIPAQIRPLNSHVVDIRLPIKHLPLGKAIPLDFKLLCDKVPPERCRLTFVLRRQLPPTDDRVPKLANASGKMNPKAWPTARQRQDDK